ncbi:hypothetical protein STA3757_00860 [Stanieria sp. NIES-3757]|nr:hypothetical protein STA3757_00860 [Stanieria sp. NIES-3757]
MTEFDTGLPHVKQIQKYIVDKQEVEFKLATDDLLVGKIIWQDHSCICLVDHYDQPMIVWRHALVYVKPKA